MPEFRFSGHESFPCRYAWLPKAVAALQQNPQIFSNEREAISDLGVGKNMVRAIRFWIVVMGIAEVVDHEIVVTPFGRALLGPSGLDRFLEDRRTLWLLHWMVLAHEDDPLFAWDYLFNRWGHPDMTRTEVLRVFEHEAKRMERTLSRITLEQHFDVFLHTYVTTNGRRAESQEDNLDCPFVDLDLIELVGERRVGKNGRSESVYAFRREPKPDITPELFVFCLFDYWSKRKANESTLTFRDVSTNLGSIGQVFKLSEPEIRERLERLEKDSNGLLAYQESATVQRIVSPNRQAISQLDLLPTIYHGSEGALSHAN
jgi:Protein of unknown function (DUF4007)